MVVFGTRPEAIKLAPVVRDLEASPLFDPVVVVTAQHRTMLDQVLDTFAIVPDEDLDVIEPEQTLTDITVRALARLTPVVARVRPDAVVVQGDTTTTFAAALSGFYSRVPVVHVEAGLRTGDPYAPFPEEINRRLTTQLASLHLAPTPAARDRLLAAAVSAADIVVTGNTVIDALRWAVRAAPGASGPQWEELERDPRRVLLVTAHRRESWGASMAAIGRAVAEIARTEPDLLVVLPVHLNPAVRASLLPAVRELANVVVTEPLAYVPFARLMARSHVILTDSGGIQEEGPSLGKPVLVMRDTTERPEAVAAGTAELVGTDASRIVAKVRSLLHDEGAYAAMAGRVNPYGDGRASARTVAALAWLLGEGPRPDDFDPAAGP
jgi:UDP-N-acetylglucosamine 2-epimerase (non-hydrolysing)